MASDGDGVAPGRCATRCGGLACKISTESKVGPPQRQSADSRPAVRPEKAAGLDFRILFIAGVIVLSMALIGVRLWYVQVVLADYYRHRIRGSSEVTVRIPSVRGEIRDRNGIPLVTNRPSYEIDFYLPDMVRGYKQQHLHEKLPTVTYRGTVKSMAKDKAEADIVQIVNNDVLPRLQ